ncbi:MAG: alpha-glucosidase, partial [Burkholderiales bacterium]
MVRFVRVALAGLAMLGAAPVAGQALGTADRNGSLVAIEPYGPNIVHVTIALDAAEIGKGAGPGISGKADAGGWTRRADGGADIYASAALRVTVDAKPWPKAPSLMERYFVSSLPSVSIGIARAGGGGEILRME